MQKIGIVVPCYHEAKRFEQAQFVKFIKDFPAVNFFRIKSRYKRKLNK